MLSLLASGCGFSVGGSAAPLDVATADVPLTDTPPPDMPGPVRVVSALRGLWKFDEGTGAIAHDIVPPPPSKPAMDLSLGPASTFAWVTGGLQVNGAIAMATTAAPHVGREIEDAGEVTVELWVTPATETEGTDPADALGADYATVFSAAGSIVSHAGLIAQVGRHWIARTRTAATNANATPEIVTPDTISTTQPTHVVITTSATGRTLYVDGSAFQSTPAATGTLGWDRSYKLRLGNEDLYDRAWHGTIWLFAIYDRALSAVEIEQNRLAGPNCVGC